MAAYNLLMKAFRRIILASAAAACIGHACGQLLPPEGDGAAGGAKAVELPMLQGAWQGFREENVFSDQPPEKVTITITGSALRFHRETNFWFETTFTLPAGTNPQQLHATIKAAPAPQADSVGQVVGAIIKVEHDTLTIADYPINEPAPKTFAEAKGRYVLKKVQPPAKTSESKVPEKSATQKITPLG